MTREQFITHVENTQKAFRRFLTALCCGNTELADDIAQEAYLKAYLASDSFDNPDKFKGWIFKIGYTTFINHTRRERNFTDYTETNDISSSDCPDQQYRYQELYSALDKLPDKERMAVLLFYIEGYPVREIADIVGASSDAVRQHLSRGRKHLRNLLSKS